MAAQVAKSTLPKEEHEDDKELQSELKLLVDRIVDKDPKLIAPALDMLTHLIRTSTTSMTSVPKPLKYLAPFYRVLKEKHNEMPKNHPMKKKLSDIISVLALGAIGDDLGKKDFDCLKYCLQGTMQNIGDWGHEYIRQLEIEIVKQSACDNMRKVLKPLIKDIIIFNCCHNAEIQACDLLMETDQLHLLSDYVSADNYLRICRYLTSCAKYVDDSESTKILKITYSLYMKFLEYTKALVISLQLDDENLVKSTFQSCQIKTTLHQMGFICARHSYPITIDNDDDVLATILGNNHLSSYFLNFARELDVMEPKSPEEIYKTWLEPASFHLSVLNETINSALQNLASSIANGFINAGFGTDKLLTVPEGSKWIYRNKDLGMLSAIAALGLLHLWDVDGGLTPIDKYLYTADINIKAGALLALGIVNCRVKNECDPALALLGDFVENSHEILQISSILGIGLAYAGTGRKDVLDKLSLVIQNSKSVKTLGTASLACGLISLGRKTSKSDAADFILTKIIESNGLDVLKSPFMLLAGLGVGLSYFGCKEAIEIPLTVMEVLDEPFKTIIQTMAKMCAYACTGNVLIVQELLRLIEQKIEVPESEVKKDEKAKRKRHDKKYEWDYNMGKAVAVLAVAAICKGEETGQEMIHRIFSRISCYGEPVVRKAVPLAVALCSVSNANLTVMDVLTKFSHDLDDDVACNGIFGLGIMGAGTNNARLAETLRQLAFYHSKNPQQLFMVRISQGLVSMGKGLLTLTPLHTDRHLIDYVAMAGILIPLVALIQPQTLILDRYHFLLYTLSVAIQPRWLLTLDEDLNCLPVTVRVGQAVDIIGKAGAPKTIASIRTHSTPVLLCTNERAELATEEYEFSKPTLDGICILTKKSSD